MGFMHLTPAGGAGLRQVRRDHAPLRAGQIGLVSRDDAVICSGPFAFSGSTMKLTAKTSAMARSDGAVR